MRRRKLLKRVGAAGVAGMSAAGAASAQTVDPEQIAGVRTTIDGEEVDLTPEEYEAHPETGSVSDVTQQACYYACKECCLACCTEECAYGYRCGSCSGC